MSYILKDKGIWKVTKTEGCDFWPRNVKSYGVQLKSQKTKKPKNYKKNINSELREQNSFLQVSVCSDDKTSGNVYTIFYVPWKRTVY